MKRAYHAVQLDGLRRKMLPFIIVMSLWLQYQGYLSSIHRRSKNVVSSVRWWGSTRIRCYIFLTHTTSVYFRQNSLL